MNTQIYILIAVLALLIIGIIVFFFRKDKNQKRLTPLAGLSLMFVLSGIIFGENRLICYSLIGIGIVLAIVDTFIKSKKRSKKKSKRR